MLGNGFCLEKPRFGGVFLLGLRRGTHRSGRSSVEPSHARLHLATVHLAKFRSLRSPNPAPYDATGLSIVEEPIAAVRCDQSPGPNRLNA